MIAMEQMFGHPYHMTLDEYWEWQDTQDLRHEFVGGVVYAMTGGSRPHARLSMRIGALLDAASRQQGCEAFVADLALLVVATGSVFYPDVMVTCSGENSRFETSPCLIVEVLSPSTQGIDRTVKLGQYSSIPALRNYLMVSSDPDEPFVVRHRRAGDLWVHTLHGPDDQLTLDCPDVTFQVADLYQ